MKKYWLFFSNEFQRLLAYRVDIASYSFGHIFEIVAQVIIWTVIFQNISLVKGYTYQEMLTYVVVGWFILFATSNYGFEEKIAREIQEGRLSNIIVKPINYIKYIMSISIGRIIFAFFVVTCIEVILIFLLRDKIIINIQWEVISLLIIMMVVAFFIRLFFSILVGFLAFWLTEVDGTYYSLNIFSKFLSGAYFPLGLLPMSIFNAVIWFPFAYTFFIPIQLYLGKINIYEGIKGLIIQFIWFFLLYGIIKIVWKRGLKKYESVGI